MDILRFHSLAEIPSEFREIISSFVELGVIKGKSNGDLDLSLDMIRCIIFFWRMLDLS